jgi:hypothetical protein
MKEMLRSLYTMLDYHIAATDGELGRVQDFLFDDESWIVDYVVVGTGMSPEKHEVLINPFAAGVPDWETKRLPALLSCQQILNSPPLTSDMPISRQRRAGLKLPGSHLRSMREVLGYSIHTMDREAGSLEDFIVEDTLWGIHHAIVALGQPPQRSILASPTSIRSISWPGKAAWMNLTFQDLQKKPDFDATSPVNRNSQHRLYDYYGRPVSPPPPFTTENRPDAPQH